MSKKTSHLSNLFELNQQIRHNWNNNVLIRASDLEQETDYSYINYIKPWVINKVLSHTDINSTIIDIGCGCGYLTNIVYECGRNNICGVDISESSILYSQNKYPDIPFVCKDICELNSLKKFDLCLAIMVVNNMPNIEEFFKSTRRLLLPSGKILVVLPHPCFWPKHHLNQKEYCYFKEVPYEFHFATKGRSDYIAHILYFHRTLETYLDNIQKAGFQVTDFEEMFETETQTEPDILCMELELL